MWGLLNLTLTLQLPLTQTLTVTEEIRSTRLRDRARAMAQLRAIWHCDIFDTTPALVSIWAHINPLHRIA